MTNQLSIHMYAKKRVTRIGQANLLNLLGYHSKKNVISLSDIALFIIKFEI